MRGGRTPMRTRSSGGSVDRGSVRGDRWVSSGRVIADISDQAGGTLCTWLLLDGPIRERSSSPRYFGAQQQSPCVDDGRPEAFASCCGVNLAGGHAAVVSAFGKCVPFREHRRFLFRERHFRFGNLVRFREQAFLSFGNGFSVSGIRFFFGNSVPFREFGSVSGIWFRFGKSGPLSGIAYPALGKLVPGIRSRRSG